MNMILNAFSRLLAPLLAASLLLAACGSDDPIQTVEAISSDQSSAVSSDQPSEVTSDQPSEVTSDQPSEVTSDQSSEVSSDQGSGADVVIELEVVGGELVGGARRESASLGDLVAVRVTGDTDDEVHVHGYDDVVQLVDGAGELLFDASIPGVFEVELEHAGVLLVQLEVS